MVEQELFAQKQRVPLGPAPKREGFCVLFGTIPVVETPGCCGAHDE